MKLFKGLWAWLDGNKMLLGTVILFFADMEGNLLGSIFVEQFAYWIGGIMMGGGFIHKLVKGKKNT